MAEPTGEAPVQQRIEVADEAAWPQVWEVLSERVLAAGIAGERAAVLALRGELGAGKTTFVKTIAAALGSTDLVSSPTFSIVQEYTTPAGPLYHFDLYRLNDIAELHDLDFEDYLRRGRLVVVEWPQLAHDWLTTLGATLLELRHTPRGGREVLVLSTASPQRLP